MPYYVLESSTAIIKAEKAFPFDVIQRGNLRQEFIFRLEGDLAVGVIDGQVLFIEKQGPINYRATALWPRALYGQCHMNSTGIMLNTPNIIDKSTNIHLAEIIHGFGQICLASEKIKAKEVYIRGGCPHIYGTLENDTTFEISAQNVKAAMKNALLGEDYSAFSF